METKEILTKLGLDPTKVVTIDDFTAAVETDFVRKSEIGEHPELVDPIIRNKMGAIQHKFITELKSIGFELPAEEIKDKRLSDIFSIALPKIKESFQGKITELEKKSGQGNDEKIKALEIEKEKLSKDYNDLKGLNTGLATEFSAFKESIALNEKKSKINGTFDSAFNKIKFKDGITPVELKGFKADLADSYKFEFNDKNEFVIRDAQDKVVNSKKTLGLPATLEEVLSLEAEKNNLLNKVVGKTGSENIKREKAKPDENMGGRKKVINFAAREQFQR